MIRSSRGVDRSVQKYAITGLFVACSLMATLKKVVYKHLGLEDIVDTVLKRMGDVDQIIVIGDYAKGIDSGNIEVVIVGNNVNYSYIAQLEEKIENIISRRVGFYLTSRSPINKDRLIIYSKKDEIY